MTGNVQPTMAQGKSYDLVIYGGTFSRSCGSHTGPKNGQISRSGRAFLIRLGGLTNRRGSGQTDIGNKQAIGGIARGIFYQNIRKHL